MKNKVGVFRLEFPVLSETFIREQALHLTRYEPLMLLRSQLASSELDCYAVDQESLISPLQKKMYAITRSPSAFVAIDDKLQRLDLIHAHFGVDGVYAARLAKHYQKPLIVTYHGYDLMANLKSAIQGRSVRLLNKVFFEAKLRRDAKFAIAVSDFVADKLRQQGWPQDKIKTHYIGVDTSKFIPGSMDVTSPYVLSVGRHVDFKGIDTLIRAWAHVIDVCPNARLLQVGDGPERGKLIQLAAQLNLQNSVHFLGARPHHEVIALLQGATAFALPSQTTESGRAESLGIVFNEASSCGVPVVSTLHGGIPEAVIHGETGYLVEERNHKSLAEYLVLLLKSPALARQIGDAGRQFVEQNFDIVKQSRKLEALYDSARIQ